MPDAMPDAETTPPTPRFRQVVLDCTDTRLLAEFYRRLLGLEYRPGHELTDPDGDDWLVLVVPGDGANLAFQQVPELPAATWPEGPVPQQLHLDLTVPDVAALEEQHRRALDLGARLLLDRSADPEEPLRVYADPAGHPFCVFVATG
jgi:catechol 2,3-dioxygenase-like lactoylglutathione lyase family enzyme